MIRLLIIVTLFVTTCFAVNKDNFDITLDNSYSLFIIKSTINNTTADRFRKKLYTYNKEEMTFFINSPGGSVLAMLDIIDNMKTSGIRYRCITKFAASAAFNIFEYCDERILMKEGTLMAHQASISIKGNITSVIRLLTMWYNRIEKVHRYIAKRIGMEFLQYDYIISKDWWIDELVAVENNLIDGKTQTVACSDKLINEEIIEDVSFYTLFGVMTKRYKKSACPLLNKVTEIAIEKGKDE